MFTLIGLQSKWLVHVNCAGGLKFELVFVEESAATVRLQAWSFDEDGVVALRQLELAECVLFDLLETDNVGLELVQIIVD